MFGHSSVAEQLAACQEGLSSMQLIAPHSLILFTVTGANYYSVEAPLNI
jgi:hypothetical protein